MTQVTDEMMRAFMCNRHGGARGGIQALFDAKLISLPVDESSIRESVVREAMALFECLPNHHYSGPSIHADLQSLLPTDRAEELVARYIASDSSDHVPGTLIDPVKLTRWLIEREVVNG